MGFDAKAFLATLTELPGVYRMLGADGSVLYVGKAKNLKKRVSSYFRENHPSPRIAHMVRQIATIETTATRTEAEALLLENNLIKTLAPRYNILFRDDKTYPYIVLSRTPFPRLGFFRGTPDRRSDYFGPFPSALAVRDSIQLLQKMFRLRTCEESVFANRSRPCLLYQIQRCSGPCVGLVTKEAYGEDVQFALLFLQGKHQEAIQRLSRAMEAASARLAFEQAAIYRDQIQSLRQVQEKQFVSSHHNEEADIIVAIQEEGVLCVNLAMVRGGRHLGDRPLFPANASDSTPAEVIAAFLDQHYAAHPAPNRVLVFPLPQESSEAGQTKEENERFVAATGNSLPLQSARIESHRVWVEMAIRNARLAITSRLQLASLQERRLAALQEILEWGESISRIECFDISHTQGESTVASCVVYQGNGMYKADYRRFNIRDISPGDDYAAMRQAVTRRYDALANGEEGKAPQIVLIDGGKGQVGVAQAALADLGLGSLFVLGVSKGEGRKPGLETIVFADGREPLQLPPEHPALHLIQEIRDEAHRFALAGHRGQRGKARKTSRLEDISGIGPARRKSLVAHFGGLSGVRNASVDQLAAVPGISRELAQHIYTALH